MATTPCERICVDLLTRKLWHNADRLLLGDRQVVAARETKFSSLVIFIPMSGKMRVSEMGKVLRNVKQLALELASGESELERQQTPPPSETAPLSKQPLEEEVKHDPNGGRFQLEPTFNRDKCLRLYRELVAANDKHRLEVEEEGRKRARIEEDRLGLTTTSPPSRPDNPSPPPSFDISVDLYTSVMFAFHDSGAMSYFQAAPGLAAPNQCPDESDDEKPPEEVKKEMKRAAKQQREKEENG